MNEGVLVGGRSKALFLDQVIAEADPHPLRQVHLRRIRGIR